MEAKETLIIGGGITGLFLAHRLHFQKHFVTLLEARESLGGRFRRANPTRLYGSSSLDFIQPGPEFQKLAQWLVNVAPIPFHFSIVDHQPQLYDDGRWRTFSGFGESEFKSIGELSSLFSHTQSLELTPGLEHLARALVEQLPFEAQTRTEVTGFKVQDGAITEVTVNGEKTIPVKNVVFTGPPTNLNGLFAGEDLPVKHRTRLAKMQSWTAVTLELQHNPPLVDDSAVRIFTHGVKDFEPVVGRVWGEHSKWMTLVPSERDTDLEYIGQCIRHIKRQLKRAWPLAFEGADGKADLAAEKIFIQPHAYGQHSLRTKDAFRLPEISNLYLAHHSLADLPGELSSVEIVQRLEAEILGTSNQLPELGASC